MKNHDDDFLNICNDYNNKKSLEKSTLTRATRPFESVTESFVLTIASLAEMSS